MSTYLADAANLQPSRHSASLTVVSWINGHLAARRARIAKRNAIAYLSTLDRYALEDMGIDVAALGEIVPRLVARHPCVVATSSLIPAQSR
jgi:hypothetical protein